MARQKRSGLGGEVIDAVGWVPWWVGVALAIVSYLLLHSLSAPPQAATALHKPGAISATVLRAMASVGQYVVPLLFLAGAGLSVFRRRAREQLHKAATSVEAIAAMSWVEFEVLVGEAYRQRGYEVVETGGGGSDGGVDLILRKNGQQFFMQCKQWKANTVGVTIVRELAGVVAAERAAGGFVVTSGRFTPDAVAFATQAKIKLVDGAELAALIGSTRPARVSVPSRTPEAAPTEPRPSDVTPTCPKCAGAMARRTARRGTNEGNAFWGCLIYPACNGTRPIS